MSNERVYTTAQLFARMVDPAVPKELQRAARAGLWSRGELSWLLHAGQKKIYDLFYGTKHPTTYLNVSRQWGKTFCCLLLGVETCLRQKNAKVRFVCPQKQDAEEISNDQLQSLIKTCPAYLRPVFNRQRKEWVFPTTRSTLRISGSERDQIRYLRGRSAHLIIIDEAAVMADLENTYKTILLPQTNTTGGRILVATTPPEHEEHYSWKLFLELEAQGASVVYDVYSNPLITPEVLARNMAACGGEQSATWQREYLCKVARETSKSVVPEWQEGLFVAAPPVPPYRHCYVGADWGQRDLTGILGAYLDYRQNKLIVEWECALKAPTTAQIAQAVLNAEAEFWANIAPAHSGNPRRVGDHDLRLFQDLRGYGLNFGAASKVDRDTNLAAMRAALADGKIIIHPRCVLLIKTLRMATWNKNRTDVARHAEIGHADLLDALLYLFRAVNWRADPYPHGYGLNPDSHFIRPAKDPDPLQWGPLIPPELA